MTIKKVGVIGAGQMGNGIAQVAATAGIQVLLNDISESSLKSGMDNIKRLLARSVTKERISQEEMDQIINRVKPCSSLDKLSDCDFVIEAASENIDLKIKIFKSLSEITNDHCILASNTSSISISKLAAVSKKPENFIGMHFMNPVPVMKLVEVISGLQTSEETLNTTLDLAKRMGKTTTLAKDIPGFIANRILMPYINEAVQTLYEGIGTVESIDTTMKLGTNVPMGPLTLADFIGLDTCLAIMEVLFDGFKDSKYRPSPLLVKYVEAGWLGKKSKKGFYSYE